MVRFVTRLPFTLFTILMIMLGCNRRIASSSIAKSWLSIGKTFSAKQILSTVKLASRRSSGSTLTDILWSASDVESFWKKVESAVIDNSITTACNFYKQVLGWTTKINSKLHTLRSRVMNQHNLSQNFKMGRSKMIENLTRCIWIVLYIIWLGWKID